MKVTVLNKKTLTIIGLVAILVVAAVINLSLKDKPTSTQSQTEVDQVETSNGEVTTSSSGSSLQVLAQYELERKSSIEKELQYLDEIINAENVDEDTLKTATDQKMLVLRNMNIEKTIAEVLLAKGFSQVTVVCGTASVNILVNANEIDDSAVAQILNIAITETDTPPENIKIIPLD